MNYNMKLIDIYDDDFENFKSNVCQLIKKLDPSYVIDKIKEYGYIEKAFENKEYLNCFYLVGLVNYLSHKYKLNKENHDYDSYKLQELIYPRGIAMLSDLTGKESYKIKALKNAEPEFLQFNIVEGEIENVY
ncbi:MAG: hypothetical protein LUF02_06180 [Erysipelotrichaceae bacterium]|nr:hypothetical protein [Erysipelotrichaceae bacterium]